MANHIDQDDSQQMSKSSGIFDAHCHPTDSMNYIDDIPSMKAKVLTIMATRAQDQDLVASTADRMGMTVDHLKTIDEEQVSTKVLPSFGWHPWFSHHLYDDYNEKVESAPSKSDHYKSTLTPSPDDDAFISSLPDPQPLSIHMERTKRYLEKYPLALIGEIGLDKSFRVPYPDAPAHKATDPDLTPGGREGRKLTPHRVDMAHQKKVMQAQMHLAGELGRAVSVHGVGAHGILFETLRETWKGHEQTIVSKRTHKRRQSAPGAHNHEKEEQKEGTQNKPKPYPPRICLHSYSGGPEHVKQYFNLSIPATIFVSFSQVINFSTPASAKALSVIKAVPDDRVLVESDVHRAGLRMDELLQEMVQIICETKGWSLEYGTQQLASNWKEFAIGKR